MQRVGVGNKTIAVKAEKGRRSSLDSNNNNGLKEIATALKSTGKAKPWEVEKNKRRTSMGAVGAAPESPCKRIEEGGRSSGGGAPSPASPANKTPVQRMKSWTPKSPFKRTKKVSVSGGGGPGIDFAPKALLSKAKEKAASTSSSSSLAHSSPGKTRIKLKRSNSFVKKQKQINGDKTSKSRLDEAARDERKSPSKVLFDSAVSKLRDKNLAKEVEGLIDRIDRAGGFPQRRRLSLRDNDLVTSMAKVVANDPSVTKIDIECDPRFQHVQKSLLLEFAEGIRTNLHLETLSIKGVELDNGFLSTLSTSLESNFTLDTIILAENAFTSDALVEFCQALGVNDSVRRVDIRDQNSPILGTASDTVLESLQKNRRVERLRIDVKSSSLKNAIKEITTRNKEDSAEIEDYDAKLLSHLRKEAVRAEELQKHRELEAKILNVEGEDDWNYLYELSELANKYKLAQELDGDVADAAHAPPSGDFCSRRESAAKMLGSTAVNLTADGAFLTDDFISSFFVEDADSGSLTFAFQAQVKLFKRFPIGDSKRRFISEKFADALVDHPRSKDITHINMANCGCGDEWLVRLCERCLKEPSLLPKLHLLNLETNYFSEAGIIALSKCLANAKSWNYVQAIKLENQRHLISSRAELELAKALCCNRSVIRFSLRVRNLWERGQINNFVSRNLDYLRQARLQHSIKTGTQVQRARNKIEQLFDLVAANDPSITDVAVVADQLFLSLPRDEIIKAAKSFANNTHVKSVRMTMLKLDDGFATTLAESIEKNSTIEKLLLDSNMIASEGITAIVRSLADNTSIVEVQLRHQ